MENQGEMEAMFQFALQGILVLNEDGEITRINPSAEKLFRYGKDELLGKSMEKLIPKTFSKTHESAGNNFNQYALTLAIRSDLHGRRKDGTEFPIEIRLSPFSTSAGNFSLIFILDITLRKPVEAAISNKTTALEQSHQALEEKVAALEKMNEELAVFTYMSSHDLQEPLRKIRIFADCILEEEKNLSETGKQNFRRMDKAASRMQTLIEDLLAYSRTKKSDRNFENTSLNLILDDVISDFEDVFKEKKATIEVFPLGHANIIQFQYRQLFHNLIGNSLKFSKPDSPQHIVIKSRVIQGDMSSNKNLLPSTKYLNLIVTDNGIGFSPEYNERIFEVFERLNSFEEYAGTGIGLAICKIIVENHRGFIAASGHLNQGARFDIYVPVE